ncbi:MAG: MarR family transcriptional regulator [Pseudomonadota bacterium]
MSENKQIAQQLDQVMRKIDAQMHRRMPSVDTRRIGPIGAIMLMHLEGAEPCSINTLAQAMGRDNSQLTRLVRNLEARGLILRRESPTDGRVTLLSVSEEGHRFLARVVRVLEEVVAEIADPLGPQEKAQLIGLLKAVNAAADPPGA